jgi:predicted peroxiredoxin
MAAELNTMIVLTTGKQDRGTRATLAFAWGCAALAMQQTASIFLTMDGTVWALKGATREVAVGGFEPLTNYVQQFTDLGGEILVCAPCSEYYCSVDVNDKATLIDEAKITGMATIVGKIGTTTKVVTF